MTNLKDIEIQDSQHLIQDLRGWHYTKNKLNKWMYKIYQMSKKKSMKTRQKSQKINMHIKSTSSKIKMKNYHKI